MEILEHMQTLKGKQDNKPLTVKVCVSMLLSSWSQTARGTKLNVFIFEKLKIVGWLLSDCWEPKIILSVARQSLGSFSNDDDDV